MIYAMNERTVAPKLSENSGHVDVRNLFLKKVGSMR